MFWTNFVFLCKQRGMSPNAVVSSPEIGMKSTGSVSAWKKGALPRQSTLNKIADYFDVDVNELVGIDLSAKKEPVLIAEDELDRSVSITLDGVLPDEVGKIHAFYAGLKASRRT